MRETVCGVGRCWRCDLSGGFDAAGLLLLYAWSVDAVFGEVFEDSCDPAGDALAEIALQRLDAGRDGGLGEKQCFSRPAEASQVSDSHQSKKVINFHLHYPRSA